MLFSSAATSSCAIAFSSASLRFVRQVLEDRRGVLARQHAEDDDLILEAERRSAASATSLGVPVAQHVAQPRVVAGAKHGRRVRRRAARPRGWPRAPRRVGAGELLFHLCQCRSDDVVMMHVRADGLDGVEPEAVNQVEIAGREGRRMRAEVIGVGAAAAVVDDEPDVERFGLVGALPGVAQQARLIVGRERRRLADVDVGRAQAERPCATMASTTLRAGTISSRTGRPYALGERDHLGEQPPLGRRRRRLGRRRPR